MSAATSTTRRWRLEGYAGKERVHTSTCVGDRALDEAMRALERQGIEPRVQAL